MEPILIWKYNEAPLEYRLPDNSGHEDWIAFVPESWKSWAYIPDSRRLDEYKVAGGKIFIGSHA